MIIYLLAKVRIVKGDKIFKTKCDFCKTVWGDKSCPRDDTSCPKDLV
jgi:hypothetical protein